tara:strand:+ start:171 stop:722 length:552 start_codon:yes stop_codon:yes gene_type:complete
LNESKNQKHGERMNRILEIGGEEFDGVTGAQVFRDRNDRPYILKPDDSEPVSYDDFGVLLLAFYRRLVQDASGLEFYEQSITEEIRQDSRKFLTNGKLTENGYWVYEGYDTEKKRVYDCQFTRYIQDETTTHDSSITMLDIANHADVEYKILHDKVLEWQGANWVREHPFYINVIEATKQLAV